MIDSAPSHRGRTVALKINQPMRTLPAVAAASPWTISLSATKPCAKIPVKRVIRKKRPVILARDFGRFVMRLPPGRNAARRLSAGLPDHGAAEGGRASGRGWAYR